MSPPTMKPQKSSQAASSSLRDVLCLVIVEPVEVLGITLGLVKRRVNASLDEFVTFLVTKAPISLEFFGLPAPHRTVSVW
jgi:hypothetical protein